MSLKIYDAPTALKCLNGVVNLYKPAGKKVIQVKDSFLHNICKDLNNLEVREPRKILKIASGGAQGPVVQKIADISDDILAVGPRYKIQDIRWRVSGNLGKNTSGVLLCGINDGTKLTYRIHQNRPMRAYHITGKLGVATENHFSDSIILSRATYRHINSGRISSLASSIQASHQRKMFELCGVDIQSQAGYELACKGLIRPTENQQPIIYGVKVIDFKPPEFTLEVHAINESESYLTTLIHDIGIELKSVAHCIAIRCIRHGNFEIQDTLLRKDWNLQSALDNINICRKVLKKHPGLIYRKNIELSPD